MPKFIWAFIGLLILYILYSNSWWLYSIERYSGRTPRLDVKKFFNGKVVGYGIINNWNGVMLRRLIVSLDGTWGEGDYSNEDHDNLSSVSSSPAAKGRTGDDNVRGNTVVQKVNFLGPLYELFSDFATTWKVVSVKDHLMYLYSPSIIGHGVLRQHGDAASIKYTIKTNHPVITNIFVYTEMFMLDDRHIVAKIKITKLGIVLFTANINFIKGPQMDNHP